MAPAPMPRQGSTLHDKVEQRPQLIQPRSSICQRMIISNHARNPKACFSTRDRRPFDRNLPLRQPNLHISQKKDTSRPTSPAGCPSSVVLCAAVSTSFASSELIGAPKCEYLPDGAISLR